MRHILRVLGVILFTLSSAAQTHVRFTATVRWPDSFEHALRPGLMFVMEPLDGEWHFAVKPSTDSQENYAECVGGPLHGPTDLDLLPWQWAATAPKGSARHVPGVQEFGFVLDEASQKYECAEVDKVAEDIREDKDSIGAPRYKPRAQGDARVTVLGFHLQLDPDGPDDEGHNVLFRDVTVAVDITIPVAKEKRPR